jgi:hypothetical protein
MAEIVQTRSWDSERWGVAYRLSPAELVRNLGFEPTSNANLGF